MRGMSVAGRFPAQRASNEESVSMSWRHHVLHISMLYISQRMHTAMFRVFVFGVFLFLFLFFGVFLVISYCRNYVIKSYSTGLLQWQRDPLPTNTLTYICKFHNNYTTGKDNKAWNGCVFLGTHFAIFIRTHKEWFWVWTRSMRDSIT